MLLKWVETAYVKHKPAICLSLVTFINYFVNTMEEYILETISPTPAKPTPASQQVLHPFYWTEVDKEVIQWIRDFSPAVAIVFGGIYSDKYGGHLVVAAGMLLYSLLMATCYLTILKSKYVFLVMLFLRRLGHYLVWLATLSIAAKVATPKQRTTVVSLVLIGFGVGFYVGQLVSGLGFRWENVSMFSAFLSFVAVIWWWMVNKRYRFMKVQKLKSIPWKDLFTSFSFYAVCCLMTMDYLLNYIAYDEYKTDGRQIRFYSWSDEQSIKIFLFVMAYNVSCLFCGVFSDYVISNGIVSAANTRRSFIMVCFVVFFLVLVARLIPSLSKSDPVIIVGLTAKGFMWGLAGNTVYATAFDFSPACAGTIVGVGYMVALFLRHIFYKLLVLQLAPPAQNADELAWSGLFFTTVFLALLSSLPFLCFKFKQLSVCNQELNLPCSGATTKEDSGNIENMEGIPVSKEEPVEDIKVRSSE